MEWILLLVCAAEFWTKLMDGLEKEAKEKGVNVGCNQGMDKNCLLILLMWIWNDSMLQRITPRCNLRGGEVLSFIYRL